MDIELNNEKILVNIIRKDNKNIYFRIDDNLSLLVTVPKRTTDKEILNLIKKNEKTLLKMYLSAQKRNRENNFFKYLGNTYTVVTDPELKSCVFEDSFIFTPSIEKLDKFIKKETIRIFADRINTWKNIIPHTPNFQLKIRRMKTRWGVCNKTNKTITLNSELIKKDISLIDYVIIHELCHFKYPHHQKEFWIEVSNYFPNYKLARKSLKED